MSVQNSSVLNPSAGRRSNGSAVNRASNQFDRKLDEILRQAAAVFSARGYHHASIRDISRATGTSLAGLYYYFSSKEELLYLIQRHAFETILSEARSALGPLRDPVDRLRTFIHLHLNYFINHPNEMTVLTHEDGSLEDHWRREVHAIKKSYFELCLSQVEALKQASKLKRLNSRVAVLSLFGMMNWIYTWYRPRIDPDASTMARQMSEIFLRGICGAWARGSEGPANLRATGARNGSHRNGRRRTAGAHGARLRS
jgi:AcrR family transcriptional regulator